MGGADAIVFTGGIGENLPDIRARICEGLEWAGLKLDDNREPADGCLEGQISSDDSSLHAFVIPTDEELLIARDTVRCILGAPHSRQLPLVELGGTAGMKRLLVLMTSKATLPPAFAIHRTAFGKAPAWEGSSPRRTNFQSSIWRGTVKPPGPGRASTPGFTDLPLTEHGEQVGSKTGRNVFKG